jgi:hypothetical protein
LLKLARTWIRETAGDGDAGPVERLVRTREPLVFYGPDASANYSLSWLLCHYLLHGEGGRHAAAFAAYIQAEARNEGGPGPFYDLLGLDPAQLERDVAAYIDKLKAT